jgi:predicted nucleic acid-binding protein
MASFVVDSSVALAWCFADEATPATSRLLDRMADESAAVPDLWFIEMTNVLSIAERKGRIEPAAVAEFIDIVRGFDFEIDDGVGALRSPKSCRFAALID